jgi:hypothetical protein
MFDPRLTMATNISEQAILNVLHQVPQERWNLVLTFIESLRAAEETAAAEKRRMTAADLLNSDLVGLWSDRTDIGDSGEFARRLREKAQTRDREG